MTETRDEELFSRANLSQRHLYSQRGVGHRRTSSNNLDSIKGLQINSHRRTHSNTDLEAKYMNTASTPPEVFLKPKQTHIPEIRMHESQQSTASLHKLKNQNGFMGILTAAIEYFDTDSRAGSVNELSYLKTEISKLNARQDDIERTNQHLISEYTKLRTTLEEQNGVRERYDQYLTNLNTQTLDLEDALKNTQNMLQLEKEKNRKLRAQLSQTASRRDSLENSSISSREPLDYYKQSGRGITTLKENEIRKLQERLARMAGRDEMVSPKSRFPVNMSIQSLNQTPVVRHIRTPSGKLR